MHAPASTLSPKRAVHPLRGWLRLVSLPLSHTLTGLGVSDAERGECESLFLSPRGKADLLRGTQPVGVFSSGFKYKCSAMRVDDEKAALCALGGAEGVKSNLVAPLLLAEQKLGTTLSLLLSATSCWLAAVAFNYSALFTQTWIANRIKNWFYQISSWLRLDGRRCCWIHYYLFYAKGSETTRVFWNSAPQHLHFADGPQRREDEKSQRGHFSLWLNFYPSKQRPRRFACNIKTPQLAALASSTNHVDKAHFTACIS